MEIFIALMVVGVLVSIVHGVQVTVEPEPEPDEDDTRGRGAFVLLLIVAVIAGIIGTNLLAVATGLR